MINVLFPGRHHLLTEFQYKYLFRIINTGLKNEKDVNGKNIDIDGDISNLIFAVTSANHSNTRRNPLPFYLRAMALEYFASFLAVPAYIYGINDVGHLKNFAEFTLKTIEHQSDGLFDLTPENTVVLCSTPVHEMYEKLGYKILPAELEDKKQYNYIEELPWEIVEHVANLGVDWKKDKKFIEKTHPASYKLWTRYNLGNKVQLLFKDEIIGEDGDITKTRDYNTYVRQMDEIANIKFEETAPFIKSGRIGDIGCAVGSWIKLACMQQKFRESDFFGIEVARQLYELCLQRKENGEFNNPFVFFAQKNAVTGLVFEKNSMDTIHTSSLTHEIESYGSRTELIQFIKNRYEELNLGGVWINRDVVAPENKDDIVMMKLCKDDGDNSGFKRKFDNNDELEKYLNSLSTYNKFLRFAIDFRKEEGYKLKFEKIDINNETYIKLKFSDACEFMTKKDYTDNWKSEMHEEFCFWSYSDWITNLEKHGFKINPNSKVFTNEWIVKNRLKGKVEFFKEINGVLKPLDYPVTHMIMAAEKII